MAPTLASTVAPSATITEFTSTSSPLPSLVAELQAELQACIKERRSGDIERMIMAILLVVCVCIIGFLLGNKFGNYRARKAKRDAEAAAGSDGVELTEIESPRLDPSLRRLEPRVGRTSSSSSCSSSSPS